MNTSIVRKAQFELITNNRVDGQKLVWTSVLGSIFTLVQSLETNIIT